MHDIRRLSLVADALAARGVAWWVDHGTLLGVVREGRLLPWDGDIDLSIRQADLENCFEALSPLEPILGAYVVKTERNVKMLPYHYGRDIDLGAYHPAADSTLEKRLVMFPRGDARRFGALCRFGWRRLRWAERTLKIWDESLARSSGGRPRQRRLVRIALMRVAKWRESLGVTRSSLVPQSFFEDLGAVEWRGFSLPVPAEPERYLEHRYGPGWRTPQRKWKWWTDDQTV